MLETIRVYAAERLAEQGRAEAVARRHLDWYLELGARAQPHLCGPGQADWVSRMVLERPNLSRAAATALEQHDHVAVIDLAWEVMVLYFVQDAVSEPDEWLQQVVAAQPSLDERQEARLRTLHALTRIHHGDYRGVHDALVESIEVFRAHGMVFETAVALHQLGFVRFHVDDDPDAAIAALEESSAGFSAVSHTWGVGLAEAMLGSVFAAIGDLESAERCQYRSLEQARLIQSDQQIVQALGQLTLIRLLQDRYPEAFDLLSEAQPVLGLGLFRTDAANALDAAAVVAHAWGDDETAAVAVCVAAAERARLGIEPWPTLRPFIARVHRWVHGSLGADTFAALERASADDVVFDTLHRTIDHLSSLRSTDPPH
jgi:hypothetical protein